VPLCCNEHVRTCISGEGFKWGVKHGGGDFVVTFCVALRAASSVTVPFLREVSFSFGNTNPNEVITVVVFHEMQDSVALLNICEVHSGNVDGVTGNVKKHVMSPLVFLINVGGL
jgi:hypothetical protein